MARFDELLLGFEALLLSDSSGCLALLFGFEALGGVVNVSYRTCIQVMIDCSHANASKSHKNQTIVGKEIADQVCVCEYLSFSLFSSLSLSVMCCYVGGFVCMYLHLSGYRYRSMRAREREKEREREIEREREREQ